MRFKADILGQFSGLPFSSLPVGLTSVFFNHNFDTKHFYLTIWRCQLYF